MFELKTTGLDALAALDHRKDILDNLIYLMKCGHVIPVMELLEQWSPKTDHYLIRYFFVQVPVFQDLFFNLSARVFT